MGSLFNSSNLHTALIVLVVLAVANRTTVGRQIIGSSSTTWF